MTYNIYYHVTETQLRVVARSTHWKRATALAEQLTKEMGDNYFLIICIEAVLVFFLFKTYLMVLKRTGIFITLLGIGTLHMVAIPKGVWDGFVGWTKQISGLCFTTFMQSTLLTLGGILMATYTGSFWLGLGILASASEVPRLIDRFGIDTGSRQGVGGAVHTASMVMHLVKGVM